MANNSIYQRAADNGCSFECSCVDISSKQWNNLMKGARPANRLKVLKVARQVGILDEDFYKRERKNQYFNPYNHFVTRTHIIYVHSGIEHFIKVN